MTRTRIVTLLCVFLAGAAWSAEQRLGHSDFLPTPQDPIGWRGDSSGVFPGATFALNRWSESDNVIWKTEIASHANSAPIVVGRKVFTTREPNYLVCVDADTGKVLWERENDPLEIRGADAKSAARVKRLAELAKMCRFIMLSPRPDDRSNAETIERQKPEFFKADDMMFAVIREAADIEPGLAGLQQEAVQTLKMRETDYRGYLGRAKRLYDGISGYVRKTYNFHPNNTWPGYIDYTYPTPASDGRCVYASMGQNQVVCYDLDGKRIWAQSPGLSPDTDGKRPQNADRATYTQSPLLADGILVVQAGFMIRAFNAANGKILWELPYFKQGGGYSCGTGAIVKIGRENHLVTVHGWMIRLKDGKQVGDLTHGNNGSEPGGQSMVVDEQGAAYYFNGKSVAKVAMLVAADGSVTGKEVYKTDCEPYGGPTPIVHDGFVYVAGKNIMVFDAVTGELIQKVPAKSNKPSPIIAGDRLIVLDDKGTFTILSLGRDARKLGSATLVWSKPRNPWFEKQWPEIYAAIGQTGRKFDNTISRQFTHSHPFAHGDRLYIRSVSHLYCIGVK